MKGSGYLVLVAIISKVINSSGRRDRPWKSRGRYFKLQRKRLQGRSLTVFLKAETHLGENMVSATKEEKQFTWHLWQRQGRLYSIPWDTSQLYCNMEARLNSKRHWLPDTEVLDFALRRNSGDCWKIMNNKHQVCFIMEAKSYALHIEQGLFRGGWPNLWTLFNTIWDI